MKISIYQKLLVILVLFLSTYFYALYEHNKYVKMDEENLSRPVLQNLPEFQLKSFPDGLVINHRDVLDKSSGGFFIHIWGTWCGPCEEEMPQFLAYAEKVKTIGVKFYLVAVNDTHEKVSKFMARFGNLPSNVQILIDQEQGIMAKFGTFKVPETYLFNSRGIHVNKFTGPQDWLSESYVTRLGPWLQNSIKPL